MTLIQTHLRTTQGYLVYSIKLAFRVVLQRANTQFNGRDERGLLEGCFRQKGQLRVQREMTTRQIQYKVKLRAQPLSQGVLYISGVYYYNQQYQSGNSQRTIQYIYYSVRWQFLTSQQARFYFGFSSLKTQPNSMKQSAN